MSQTKTKIVLNGRTYDLSTGKPTEHSSTVKPPAGNHTHKKAVKKSVDGFMHTKPIHSKRKVLHRVKHQETKAPHHSVDKRFTHHTKHHKPQRSQTLMRSAVSQPISDNSLAQRNDDGLLSISPQNRARLERAKKISKSSAITRFPKQYLLDSELHSSQAVISPRVTETSTKHHSNADSHKKETRLHTQGHKKSKQEEVFQRAMEKADAHKQRPVRHHKRRISRPKARHLKLASVSLSVLLLTGFILYQNIPNLSVRIASSKAGFSAKLPGYKPSGYSVAGPIVYSPGKITINFSSNSDNRNFVISEQVSNWNSQALVDNFLAASNPEYQSFQEKGKTIYIYGNNNATWVSGGVWYNLQGGVELNTDQLLKIAASL